MNRWFKGKQDKRLHEELSRLDFQMTELRLAHSRYTVKARWWLKNNDEVPEELAKKISSIEYRGRLLREERDLLAAQIRFVESLRASEVGSSPKLGERLLLLILTKEERVNIPGDLEEEYRGIAAKHGARYAKLWYCKQVAASAWPMVRKAVRLGIMAWVGEWIRRRV